VQRIQHLNELAQRQNWVQQGTIRPIPDIIRKKLADDKQMAATALKKETEKKK
jgi:hypothetical protein